MRNKGRTWEDNRLTLLQMWISEINKNKASVMDINIKSQRSTADKLKWLWKLNMNPPQKRTGKWKASRSGLEMEIRMFTRSPVKNIFSQGLTHIVLGREVNVNSLLYRKVHHWEGKELFFLNKTGQNGFSTGFIRLSLNEISLKISVSGIPDSTFTMYLLVVNSPSRVDFLT